MHVGELGEPLRQLDRLGLGEAVVGGVEVVVNGVGVGVGAVLNGNKVVVGGGKVCDARCVCRRCSVGWDRGDRQVLVWEARDEPGDRGHGDLSAQDVWSRFLRCRLLPENEVWGRTRQQAAQPWCCVEGKESGRMQRLPKQSDDRVQQRPKREVA